MNGRVLVLNQDYSPMTVCTVQRAFVLVLTDKAELLREKANESIRTVTRSYPKPAVVKLNRYINIPFKSVVLSRNNIFKRDRFHCQYCDSNRDLTLDHVMPRSRQGKSSWNNLVTACKSCNARKGDYTPEEANMILKNQPYRPSFLMFLKNFSSHTSEEWLPFLNKKVTVKL